MGRLTTHVLDTANGKPAAGVDVRVYLLGEKREMCAAATTNADGRTEKPLLADEAFASGTYELEFDIGNYFSGNAADAEHFLDTVVIRVTLSGDEHYHVPLLASPWSYSTYRGS